MIFLINHPHKFNLLGSIDELDSFLYQTVGHDAIEYYAECINLPLYRREIMGSSLVQSADYQQTSGDETEDLYQLLKQVKVV